MHRMQSEYGRRLVNFHREHDIPPRSSSPAPHRSLTVVTPTVASKPRRPMLHPLLIVYAIVAVLSLAQVVLEFAYALRQEARALHGDVAR